MRPLRSLLDSMLTACYWHAMANLQVKNVPEDVHRKIRAYAKRRGRSVRDIVLEVLVREIEAEEFRARLAKREPVDLGRSAARSVEEARRERESELGG
jgi:plasmid stability protein